MSGDCVFFQRGLYGYCTVTVRRLYGDCASDRVMEKTAMANACPGYGINGQGARSTGDVRAESPRHA